MKVFCPRHDENHNITPRNVELLIYYLRRAYIDVSYAAPMPYTDISAGPEYTYNRICVLDELASINSEENGSEIVAHAKSDLLTRMRKDKENPPPKRNRRK